MDVFWPLQNLLQGRGHNWQHICIGLFHVSMFQGIWISLGSIYLMIKINIFFGMGNPPPLWKIPPILLIFLFNPSLT